MADRMRVVFVLALCALGVLAAACRPHGIARPDAPHGERWILPARASDDDPFCVLDPSDAWPLRCTTVEDVRRYIRGQRSAE